MRGKNLPRELALSPKKSKKNSVISSVADLDDFCSDPYPELIKFLATFFF
jgi:hypothetical protein